MALLRFSELSFAYPNAKERALDRVSLCMDEGEYIVLCGPSGCGKTTLLRQAKPGLTPAGAAAGEVRYRGLPLTQADLFRTAAEIGFVQQNPDNQIVTDYVWHELAFGLENLGLSTLAIRRRVAEMAAFFGMESWFRAKTTEISGGQKQLLNLASIMAMQPRLLILDEPTAMLDPLAARALLDAVRRINKDLGLAVLLTEHRLEEVFPQADRAVLMNEGRIVAEGPPRRIAHLLSREADKSRLYFGLPAAARIFSDLDVEQTPLSVRDGRAALKQLMDPAEPAVPPSAPAAPKHNGKTHAPETALKAKELWFRYEEKGADILRGLSLSLYRGERLALLGGNGAGKTTLLKLLAGIKKPYRGQVLHAKSERLCMLPQNAQSLFTYDTLGRELLESADGDQVRADETATQLELTALLNRHPYDLSGGETERAALAKLLLRNASILLLDEPTKGLDAYAKRDLAGILKRLTEVDKAILIVTHDIEFAAAYTDRCALLFDGVIISADDPHALFSGNRFYTTAAHLIAADYFPEAVTCEEVIAAWQSCLSAGGREARQ